MTTTSIRRRFGASLLAAALAGGFLALAASPNASATTKVTQARLAGTDRFATAADIATKGFPNGSPTVIVASGRAFPDALAGASLGLPILLTEQATLPSATSKAISDLKATKALILGGTAAVSDAVKTKIQSSGVSTTRIAGLDRYETAGEIAGTFTASDVATLNNKPTAIIATGKDFADALAGGPLASAPTTGAYPVLLVNETVPPATKKAIANLGIKQVVILGGTTPVSPAVETELEAETGSDAIRLAGTNRYGTATKIADAAIANFGFDAKEALLANARSFSDALAGGPIGAIREAPLLLTDQVQLNAEPKTWLVSHSSTVATVTALGGSAAVSDSTLAAAEKAAETPPASRLNEKYVVTPTVPTETGSSGTVSYSAKVGTDTVDIVLVKCDRVQTTSAGNTTFANSNANTIADGTAKSGNDNDPDLANTTAAISSVNGVPTDTSGATTNPNYADAKKGDANGTLTFDVDGPGATGSECVVPVVFNDADLSNSLLTPTSNPAEPTELFGTGGEAVYRPAEATASQFHVSVRESDDDFNSFVGCTLLDESQPDPPSCQPNGQANYFYDDNDTFQVTDGTAIRPSYLAEFETMLTAGDDARGNYNPDPKGVSTFIIYNDKAPEAPTPSAAPVTQDSFGVHITVLDSSRATVDSYRLFRFEKPSTGCPDTSPALSSSYVKVGEEVPDATIDANGGQYTMTDPSPEAGKTYCYTVASVDDGDVGPGFTPAKEVTITAGTGSAAPTIVSAKAFSADDKLSAGDVHEFVFSEPMAESTARSATYTVHGTLVVVSQTIDCSATATVLCGLSADGKTMHVHLLSGFTSTLSYPLTISATTLMTDRDATPKSVDVTDTHNDTTIDQATLTNTDVARPAITAVSFVNAGGHDSSCSGFGQPLDVLKLTFGTDTVALHVADSNKLTKAELDAILGPDGTATTADDTAYNADTEIKATLSGSDIILEVVKTMAHGVENGDAVNGTSNNVVTDAAGNPQQPATGKTLPAASSTCT